MKYTSLPDHLTHAFRELDKIKDLSWAYTVLSKEPKHEKLMRFNPTNSSANRFDLIEINGRAPTKADNEAHRKKQKQDHYLSQGLSLQKLPDMASIVPHTSLTKTDENTDYLYYQFTPKLVLPLVKDVGQSFNGEIEFCKQSNIVKQIRLKNNNPFAPLPSVKIERFQCIITFGRIADNHVHLLKTETRLKGKMLYVKEIKEESISTYSEHHKIPL